MRLALAALVLSGLTLNGCKARQGGASVRDTPEGEAPAQDRSSELNTRILQLAGGLRDDFELLATGTVAPGNFALTDTAPTPEELDALKKQLADLTARYRNAVARSDRASAERLETLNRLTLRLEAAQAALKAVDPENIPRYVQAVGELRRVVEDIAAVADPNAAAAAVAGGAAATVAGQTPPSAPVDPAPPAVTPPAPTEPRSTRGSDPVPAQQPAYVPPRPAHTDDYYRIQRTKDACIAAARAKQAACEADAADARAARFCRIDGGLDETDCLQAAMAEMRRTRAY